MSFPAGLHISLSLKKDECIRLYDGEGTSCKYTVKQIQTLVQAGNQLLEKCWVDQKRHVAICCIAKKKCIDEWHIVEEDKGKDERTDNSSENRKAKVTKNYNTVSIGWTNENLSLCLDIWKLWFSYSHSGNAQIAKILRIPWIYYVYHLYMLNAKRNAPYFTINSFFKISVFLSTIWDIKRKITSTGIRRAAIIIRK